MRSSLLLTSSLLAVSAWAAPGSLCKKGACNADNCLRAVRASSASPFPSSATADCSSFMKKTVTPCPATSTAHTTVTVTKAPVFVTATDVVTNTMVNTVTQTDVTVVTTIEDTVTFIQPTEVDVINIIVTAVTVTAPLQKRDQSLKPLPEPLGQPTYIQARSAAPLTTSTPTPPATTGSCAATTGSPSKVPTYASACSGTVRYSSACSCAGVTGATTTISQSTVTTTSTSTVTVTPTTTAVITKTDQVPITVTQTEFVPSTFETTDATVIIQSAFTLTSNIVIPTTVVVAPPPSCTAYNFVATSGTFRGQFLKGDSPDPDPYNFVEFTSDATQALSYVISSDGRVVHYDANGGSYGWVTNFDNYYYILQMSPQIQSEYGSSVQSVFCTLNAVSTTVPGAVGQLSCTTAAGAAAVLQTCPAEDNILLQATSADPYYQGCQASNLVAVPAGAVAC